MTTGNGVLPDPRLSIVIGTFNRRTLLERCISSIFEQTQTPFRVFVTDAGSTDGTIDYLKSLDEERVCSIFVGRKLGQAKAYNDVFKDITSKYVCWLSDDNIIVNRSLDVAVEILEDNPEISMVGLKVKDVAGPFADAPYIGGVSPAGILNVNQGLLRTSAIKEVGFFSETFGFYGIDPDLTAKVLHAGHDIVYTREVAIQHHRSWETDPGSRGFAALQDHHRKFRRLYDAKYGHLGRLDLVWHAKRGIWWLIRQVLGKAYSIDDPRSFLGYVVRDWNNLFASRHISLFDSIRSHGKTYYLRQHCRWYKRDPSVLSDDKIKGLVPVPEEKSAGTLSDVHETEQ